MRIKASPEEVYHQLATSDGVAKWPAEQAYSTDKATGELKLTLWGETDFIVTENLSSSRIVWHCTSKDNPWFGTDIAFELREESDKTLVTFDHAGWPEISDLYRDCAMSWAYFLESLRSLIEDRAGTPQGVAPECEASTT
jgi:uncharacterized protein YndB with AHSA1/START domain